MLGDCSLRRHERQVLAHEAQRIDQGLEFDLSTQSSVTRARAHEAAAHARCWLQPAQRERPCAPPAPAAILPLQTARQLRGTASRARADSSGLPTKPLALQRPRAGDCRRRRERREHERAADAAAHNRSRAARCLMVFPAHARAKLTQPRAAAPFATLLTPTHNGRPKREARGSAHAAEAARPAHAAARCRAAAAQGCGLDDA
jgi:hypothetical protein